MSVLNVWRRVSNLKLIQQNNQETDDSSISTGGKEAVTRQSIYKLLCNRPWRLLLVECVPLSILIMLPLSVHAGALVSFLGFIGEDVIVYERPSTSVTTASEVKLLSSISNPDPKAALGGGDIIIDEGSLVSGGPFGEDYSSQGLQNGEISVYVVRTGDSLSQIAEMFGVTTNTILWANELKSATDIHPGDSLIILPIVGVRHVVKSGDTVQSIAKKYESDVEEILSYNQLASASDLAVGDTLIIPGGNLHEAAPTTPPKKSSSKKTSSGTTKATASALSGGGFINPLPGSVRTQGVHGYNGVDLAGVALGSAVRAAAAGEVIVSRSSGWNGGYGSYVVIKHSNGTQTLYAHLSSVAVGVGDYVAAGETLGGVGSTGRSTGVHLHFEVRGASNPF